MTTPRTSYDAATNPSYRLNLGDFQERARNIYQRGGRVATIALDRARAISEKDLGAGRMHAFSCAHNWHGQEWMTPAQNAAASEILRLQQRSYRINAIVRTMVDKLWADFDRIRETSAHDSQGVK